MFSGIIEKTASVLASDGRVLEILRVFEVAVGDSVAVNGVCLTVSGLTDEGFRVDLSEETSKRTSLGGLEPGDQVNLERALPADGRFGGHIVQGHVDGVAYLMEREQLSGSVEFWVESSPEVTRYMVEKGPVALDGVSLTVVSVKGDRFTVSVIPHSLNSTNLKNKKPGDSFNVEVDIVAKYVEKLAGGPAPIPGGEEAGALPELPDPGGLSHLFQRNKPQEQK